MTRKTDMKFSLPEIGSKNWADVSIEHQFEYNRASKSSRIERKEVQASKSSSSNPNVDILKLHNDGSDDMYDFDEDDEELSLLYSTDDELNQKKKQTKISFSTMDDVRVYCPDPTAKTRPRCPNPRRKTIDDHITVIGRTVLYKGRHSNRVAVMSRISDVSVESPLPTPRDGPSTPTSVPSTPRRVPSPPISVPSRPISAPTTPRRVPSPPISVPSTPRLVPSPPMSVTSTPITVPFMPKNVPPTPALVGAESYTINIAGSDTTATKANKNICTAVSQTNSFIYEKSPNIYEEMFSHSSNYGEKKQLRSALPPVKKTTSHYLPTINTRASQSVRFTREQSSVNMAKESQHRYKQPKVVNNTKSRNTKATSVTDYKSANNSGTTVKLPNINKPSNGKVSEKADRKQKSTIPVLPKIAGPRASNCGTKHRGRQGL